MILAPACVRPTLRVCAVLVFVSLLSGGLAPLLLIAVCAALTLFPAGTRSAHGASGEFRPRIDALPGGRT